MLRPETENYFFFISFKTDVPFSIPFDNTAISIRTANIFSILKNFCYESFGNMEQLCMNVRFQKAQWFWKTVCLKRF